MEQNDPNELHRRFLAGKLSRQELESYIQQATEGKFDDSFPDFEQVARLYPKSNRKPILWRSVAAAIALLVLLGGYQLWFNNGPATPEIVYKTIQVDLGKKMDVTLTDGTSVSLSPGTIFSYPERFSDTVREVRVMEGKVFLNVAKDAARPFKVHTGKLETVVLGTSFTVENYRKQEFEKINLYTGKVTIRNTQTTATLSLSPGQLYEWDGKAGEGSVTAFDPSANPAQVESLTFAQASLESVLYRIALLKGITITLEDNRTANYRISGTFDRMSTDEILQSMELIHKLKINKIDSNTYLIMKK